MTAEVVTLADGCSRSVLADTFRVEGGALILLFPTGCAAAYAPGQWLRVETIPQDIPA